MTLEKPIFCSFEFLFKKHFIVFYLKIYKNESSYPDPIPGYKKNFFSIKVLLWPKKLKKRRGTLANFLTLLKNWQPLPAPKRASKKSLFKIFLFFSVLCLFIKSFLYTWSNAFQCNTSKGASYTRALKSVSKRQQSKVCKYKMPLL